MFAIGRAICIASSIALFLALAQLEEHAFAENVICDPAVNTSIYYCRGWQDGVGKYGSRVRFIARIMGEDGGDDLGADVATMGDINGDGRGDFMVWVKNKCEWRIFLGDSIIAKEPYLIWPRGNGPYPCNPFPGTLFSIGDVTGDNEPDLVRRMGAFPPDLRLQIYAGGAAFDTVPEIIIPHTEFVVPGRFVGGVDLNGDSQSDLVVGDPYYFDDSPWRCGRVYVFWGGSALDSIPDLIFTDTCWEGRRQPAPLGGALALVPSINGDAYADLILGRKSQDEVTKDPLGRVDVYYGGPGMDTVRDLTFSSPDTNYFSDCGYTPARSFGGIVKDIGDANQDGHRDLCMADFSGCCPTWVYYGGTQFDTIADLRPTSMEPGEEEGHNTLVSRLGDVDGDGHEDFSTGMIGGGIFEGVVRIRFSASNPSGVADWEIRGGDWAFTYPDFGRIVTTLGDVNGDGFDDVGISTRSSQVDNQNEGVLYIFAGYNPDINTGVFDDPETPLPSSHRLIDYAAPNPFNSTTIIRLAEGFTSGTIVIYDILGRAVRTFDLSGESPTGEVIWDGRDRSGRSLASGLYFARAGNGRTSETYKLVLLK